MSGYDGNYGENYERDVLESQAYERELEAEHVEHEQEAGLDRLRRDDPCVRSVVRAALARLVGGDVT